MSQKRTSPSSGSALSGKPLDAITGKPLIGFEEPGQFYVNSGQSLSRGEVEERFPEANFRGAVSVALLERELGGPVKTTTNGSGYVVSKVTIRQEIERLLGEGKVSKRKANRIQEELRKQHKLIEWRKLPCITDTVLSAYVKARPAQVLMEQRARAADARGKKSE